MRDSTCTAGFSVANSISTAAAFWSASAFTSRQFGGMVSNVCHPQRAHASGEMISTPSSRSEKPSPPLWRGETTSSETR